jgi:DNA-binding NarL/FixJ family response regulator
MSTELSPSRTRVGIVRVIIACHDPVLSRGLRCVLEEHVAIRVVAEARSAKDALYLASSMHPDVVLVSASQTYLCNDVHAVSALSRLSRVLLLSLAADSNSNAEALRHGATGFLVQGEYSEADLRNAVFAALRDRRSINGSRASSVVVDMPVFGPRGIDALPPVLRRSLSPREATVMDCIAKGMDNREIAHALTVSEKTVKNHVNHIYPKLGVKNRVQAIVLWLRSESVTLDAPRLEAAATAIA